MMASLKHSRTAKRALIVSGIMLAWSGVAAAQQGLDSTQRRKEQLEVEKLEAEVAKLKQDRVESARWWLTAIQGFVGGAVTAAVTIWGARRTLIGGTDQPVHGKRLELYPRLMKTAAPLAVYFPAGSQSPWALRPEDCKAMGRAMSEWYFDGGGLLLSVKARDAYFRLATALTRASSVKSLRVPTFPGDADNISVEKLKEYRAKLANDLVLDDVESWRFGCPESQDAPMERRFQDYLFLQRLASALRTALAEDLRSRRRPS